MHNYKIIEFSSLDSTNEEAKRRVQNGEAENGQVILAHEQSGGRGRSGRVWQSPPGNLYFSILLKLEGSLEKISQVSFVAAVALGELITEILPKNCAMEYKWPNDILVNGKKISGILLESVLQPNLAGGNWFVIGVGLNINSYPENLADKATSLADCGLSDMLPNVLLDKFIILFDKHIKSWKSKGFQSIRDVWVNNAFRLGEEIVVNSGNQAFTGIFKTMNTDGELELILGDEIKRISSGEVFF